MEAVGWVQTNEVAAHCVSHATIIYHTTAPPHRSFPSLYRCPAAGLARSASLYRCPPEGPGGGR